MAHEVVARRVGDVRPRMLPKSADLGRSVRSGGWQRL